RDRRLRREEPARHPARLGRARRGGRHYPPRQGRRQAGAGQARRRSREGSRRAAADSRAGKTAQGQHHARGHQGLARRRPAVSLVLDSSATLAWIYQDEVSDGTRRIFDQVAASGAWVPSLWRLEIANGLQNGIRRKRIDAGFRAAALANLSELDITF